MTKRANKEYDKNYRLVGKLRCILRPDKNEHESKRTIYEQERDFVFIIDRAVADFGTKICAGLILVI